MWIRLLVNVIRLRSFRRAWWVYEYERAEFHAARLATEQQATLPARRCESFYRDEGRGF